MSLVLENIIRQFLFEAKARMTNLSQEDRIKARTHGAQKAFAVKVMGSSDKEVIKQYVHAAILASVPLKQETEKVEAVGANSKYGKETIVTTDGKRTDVAKWIYVMSDPLPERRQLVIVYIMPNPVGTDYLDQLKNISATKTTSSTGEISRAQPEVVVFASGDSYPIGNTLLVSLTSYNKVFKQIAGFKTLVMLNSETEEEPEDIDYKKTSSTSTEEPEKISATTPTGEIPKDVVQNKTIEITYPFEYNYKNTTRTFYTYQFDTINLYLFIGDKWYYTNKKEFEKWITIPAAERTTEKSPLMYDVTDENTINRLNLDYPENKETNKANIDKAKEKEKNKKKTTSKTETTYKKDEYINVAKTKLYKQKNGKFVEDPDVEWGGKGVTQYKYTSKDKKYIYVYFKNEKSSRWVPASKVSKK
jgi:hypothetical protein